MRYLLTTIFIFFAIIANGQTVSLSPTSVPLWGTAPATAKITAEYDMIEAVYLHVYENDKYDITDKENPVKYKGDFFGLFVNPISIEAGNFEFEGGAGYFFRKYPTKNGTHINFQAKVSYHIADSFSIQYSHISNGFGAFNELNPGVDHLSIKYHF